MAKLAASEAATANAHACIQAGRPPPATRPPPPATRHPPPSADASRPCGPHPCGRCPGAWRHGLRERDAGRALLPRRENNRDIRGHLRGAASRHLGCHAQGASHLIASEPALMALQSSVSIHPQHHPAAPGSRHRGAARSPLPLSALCSSYGFISSFSVSLSGVQTECESPCESPRGCHAGANGVLTSGHSPGKKGFPAPICYKIRSMQAKTFGLK